MGMGTFFFAPKKFMRSFVVAVLSFTSFRWMNPLRRPSLRGRRSSH